MKEIYFSKDQGSLLKRLSKTLMFYGTETMGRTLPDTSLRLAEKMLCTPSRPASQLRLDGFSETTLQVRDQLIHVYSKGESDRVVVFAHGWSGHAGNFTSFYESFLKQGYRVVAFDHVAHGSSTGPQANLFLFIEGTRAVLKWASGQDRIAGVVAHSMGASAIVSVLSTPEMAVYHKVPLALIAPVIPLFESLETSVDNFGISRRWLNDLMQHFEERYELKIPNIDPKERIKTLKNPVLIFHDTKDTYIPLETNLQYIPEALMGSVVKTEKLGHFRILKSSPLVEQALGFIDATRN